jgi:hypothetical protein
MSESYVRRKIVSMLKELDAQAVENPIRPGTPDVNYVEGWLELKWLERWPVRGGVVNIKHFTPQQRIWLKRRWNKGGRVYLLLNVGRDWLLFNGLVASSVIGNMNKEELIAVCDKHWHTRINKDELIKELTTWKTLN